MCTIDKIAVNGTDFAGVPQIPRFSGRPRVTVMASSARDSHWRHEV